MVKSDSKADDYCFIGACFNLALASFIFLAALCEYVKICRSGNWLTKRGAFFIALAQLFNLAMTLQLIYVDYEQWWQACILARTTFGFIFLNEYVLWAFAYFYWVTSQNAAVIYHNGIVMYSNLTQKEKDSRMKDSTVDDKCNWWVNKIYVGLLFLMLAGFAAFNFRWLFLTTHDDTQE